MPNLNVVSFSVVSIACYAAQIWGFQQHEELERLQRFFIKKLFGLPSHTPNYALSHETKLAPLFFYAWDLHTRYCLKTLRHPDHRLTKKIAIEIIHRRQYWFLEWIQLFRTHEIAFDEDGDTEVWHQQLLKLGEIMFKRHNEEALARINQSERSLLYRHLVTVGPDYCPVSIESNAELKGWEARWLFKLRVDLLYLNSRAVPFRVRGSELCSLCNLGQKEDMYHFVAICPVLSELRKKFTGKVELEREHICDCLLGKQPPRSILLFVRAAWKYRHELVLAFNYI